MKDLFLKKGILAAFILSLVFTSFSCSDDKESGSDFEPFTITYSGANLQIGAGDAPENASVTVTATSNSNAQVTLKNIIEGQNTVVISGSVARDTAGYSVYAENEKYSFVGIVVGTKMSATITQK